MRPDTTEAKLRIDAASRLLEDDAGEIVTDRDARRGAKEHLVVAIELLDLLYAEDVDA